MIHANTDAAIQMWVKAGAKPAEHGFFTEDDTAKLMAEKRRLVEHAADGRDW